MLQESEHHAQMSGELSVSKLSASTRSKLVLVARRFYLEDKSKVEIAQELGCSRFKVARMLEHARELGVVTITLDDQGTIDYELSERLAGHLDLDEAVVVEASGTDEEVRRRVAVAAADVLSKTLTVEEVLGLAWGRTLRAMTERMPSVPPVSVIQLTGAVSSRLEESPVEIVRKVALSSGGRAQAIFAPLLLDDAGTATALRRQPDVAQVIGMFDLITTAVVAVGSWDPPDSQLWDIVRPQERDSLLARGVRAEVAAILVADDGSMPAADFAERCISVTADQLAAVPRVIGVAAGAVKTAAVTAVARAGLLTGVVADRRLAEAVLAAPPVRRAVAATRAQRRPRP